MLAECAVRLFTIALAVPCWCVDLELSYASH